MKKLIKLTAIILVICAICLSLGGCRNIDDLRAHQMFWGDKNHSFIEFEKNKYKKLSLQNDFELVYADYSYNITDKDVPVLISAMEGGTASLSKDKELIFCDPYIYAREDVSDKYDDYFQSKNFTKFGTIKYNFNHLKDENFISLEVFDDETQSLIFDALSSSTEVKAYESNEETYTVDVLLCDESKQYYTFLLTLVISKSDKKVYFEYYNESTVIKQADDALYDKLEAFANRCLNYK